LVAAHNGSREFSLDEKFHDWQKRDEALQIGYAGHLYKGRGIELIISCAKEITDADFHILGGTERDISYWKERTKLPNLLFHGFVSPGEVYKFRNMMYVLLAPYPGTGVTTGGGKEDSSKYMNPIKIIEYMSSRKAIIASDLPPIREVLDASSALLVNSDSAVEWISAIETLRDPDARKKIAEKAYANFQRNLTWKARVSKLIIQNKSD
jgi:glycosyltransferase involved in cell wall biosynthesis